MYTHTDPQLLFMSAWSQSWSHFSLLLPPQNIFYIAPCLPEDVNNLWLISNILSSKCDFYVFMIFDKCSHIFLPNSDNMLFWDANCGQSIHFAPQNHWVGFVENFLIKSCFFIIQWFSQFWCMSKLFRMWGATVMRLALCVYLYLGHDCLHLYEEKVDLSKTVFIQLPYTTWVVNKHLYETWWSGLTPAWYSENISVIAIY